MIRASIHQPNYLPWLGYFYKLLRSDVFVALDDAQYTKGSYINRTKIKTPTGWQWLTVPVLTKGRLGQTIAEVQLNNRVPWSEHHLKAIRLNYARSQYFGEYLPALEDVLGRSCQKLADLNIGLIRYVSTLLGIETKIIIASDLDCPLEGTERLVEICRRVGADTYLSGSGGSKYQDEGTFAEAGIKLVYSDFVHPTYAQQWGGFMSGLSIIDFLFNCGRKGVTLFKSAFAEK